MLLEKWNAKIKDILYQDNYNPIEISSQAEFNELFEEFPCKLDTSVNIIDNENYIQLGLFRI